MLLKKTPSLFKYSLIFLSSAFFLLSIFSTASATTVSTPYVWIPNGSSNNVTKLNSSGSLVGTYSAGVIPYGIAVDASGNVWVVNNGASTVTKLNSSGDLIGTYSVGNSPKGIAIDASGNVWVANDSGNNVTKLNSSGGTVGTYSVGSNPVGVAVDASGNVWVTNQGSASITKLNSSGGLVGTYAVGSLPDGVAFDASGNIWVANFNSNNVTKLNSSGGLVGTYSVGTNPRGVAIDASGNVWVANEGSASITKLNSSGSTVGTYSVGSYPFGVAVDVSGNVWVSNTNSHNVTKLNSSGGLVGTYSVGFSPYSFGDFTGFALQYFVLGYSLPAAPTMTLSAASGITATTAVLNGNITDNGGSSTTVTVYWGTSDGGTTAGNWTNNSAPTSPSQPQDIAAFTKNLTSLNPNTLYYFRAAATNSSGTTWATSTLSFTTDVQYVSTPNVWVDNAGSNNVTKLNSSGGLVGTYTVGTTPYGIAIDASGNVWMANYIGTNNVTKLNSSGGLVGTYNVGTYSTGIAIDASNNVWVANLTTNNVTKLNSSGGLVGTYNVGTSPYGIAIDASGNVWVANNTTNNVTKLNSSGGLVGTYTVGTTPYGIAIDASGNVWVTNTGSSTVTKLNSSGGLVGTYSVGSGPKGVAVDNSGNVWVTNAGSNTVTKLDSSGGLVGTYTVGTTPYGIAIDASNNVWVTNFSSNNVTKLNSSGGLVGTYNVGTQPWALGDFTGFALQHFVLGYDISPAVTTSTVTVSAPTNLTSVSATFNGSITDTGGDNPSVTFYYGHTDMGTTTVGWDNIAVATSPTQPQAAGVFSRNILSLIPNFTYYYRAKAVNSAGTSWSPTAETFVLPDYPLSTSLVGEWHMNNNWLDSSGNGNDGTAQDNATFGAAKLGSTAGSFDGTGDYVSVPDSDNWNFSSGNFTINFWVNLNQLTSGIHLLNQYGDSNNRMMFYINVANNYELIFLTISGGSTIVDLESSALTWNTSQWYHLSVVRNGNEWKLFRNNIQIGSITDSDTMPNISGPLYFGQYGGGSYGLNGRMDETCIWNRALSTTSITTLYNGGLGLQCDGTPGQTAGFSIFKLMGGFHLKSAFHLK
ncbi:MAG: LamG-like jellyroll fold domain-containing protein [Minisyncoccia bacterium]